MKKKPKSEITKTKPINIMLPEELINRANAVCADQGKGKRKECTFPEMRDMEIDERLDFLDKIDEDEKVTKWQKHLECFMNALAR